MKRRAVPFQPLPETTEPHSENARFSIRGGNVSRLEGFSDAVFGFALTILVVSLNPPQSFSELSKTVQGAVPFAMCFAGLVLIWYKHYRFFREYGLEDKKTILLNSILLFTVLFYVYPLRLLFHLWVASIADKNTVGKIVTTWEEVGQVMVLFGVGCSSILLVFGLLYRHALSKSKELGLTPHEQADARISQEMNLLGVAISLLSILCSLLLPPHRVLLSAWVYAFMIPSIFFLEPYLRRRVQHSY